MSQIEDGLRSILNYAPIYNSLQLLMGAKRIRKQFINDDIQAQSGDNILDIGCGTAEILSHLPHDINYFGFDQSEAYIKHAISKFGNRGIFKNAFVDSLLLDSLPRMNIVLASGLIHHLEDDQVLTLLQTAQSALTPKGRFIAIDPCYTKTQNCIAKYLIDKDRGNNIRNQNEYSILAKQLFKHVESRVIHRTWIPYTHHIMVCYL